MRPSVTRSRRLVPSAIVRPRQPLIASVPAGETRTLNQPGTSDQYPNWRLPLADVSGVPVRLEALLGSARAAALARAVSS